MRLRERVCTPAVFVIVSLAFACSSGGSDGTGCVTQESDGGTVIVCEDGTSATVDTSGGGQPGADGKDGADGAEGTSGTDGTDGTNGTDGEDGDNGQDGDDGADGTECTVTENGDGTATVDCPDGSSTTYHIGSSTRVVYRSDQETAGIDELFLVDVEGNIPSKPVKVSGDMGTDSDVDSFRISDDGNTLVYMADQDTDNLDELYYVDLSGDIPASPVKANGTLQVDGEIDAFSLSKDGNSLVYQADQDTDDVYELYLVDLSSGTPSADTKISGTMVTDGDTYDRDFGITDDGNAVVFIADKDTDDIFEIYFVDISGSSPAAPVKLNDALAADREVAYFVMSSDGGHIVYRADRDTDDQFELYYVDNSGNTPESPVKLNDTLGGSGSDVEEVHISSDGSTVIYRADQDTEGVDEAYVVDLTDPSPAPEKINGTLVADGDVLKLALSSDGSKAAYIADQDTNTYDALYYVDISSGTPFSEIEISGPLDAGRDISNVIFSLNGEKIVYRGDQDVSAQFELYYVDVSSGIPTGYNRINSQFPSGRDVQSNYMVSNDGDTVLYRSDEDTDNIMELFLVTILPNHQHLVPLKLNVPIHSDRDVDLGTMTP